MLTWPNKDPDEILDYKIDWSNRLDEDIILSSVWIVPSGITKDSDSFTNTDTTIWLSDGTEGENLTLTNRVMTEGGRTYDQSVRLRIKSK